MAVAGENWDEMTGDVGDEVVETGPAALDGQNDAYIVNWT